MTHSVPPPKPPAIIQNLPPQAAFVTENKLTPLVISQSVAAKAVSLTTRLKTPSPEPAASNAAKSATLLGPEIGIGIGYPIKQSKNVSSKQTLLARLKKQRKTKPIPPFRPSASVGFNKLLVSQLAAPETAQNGPATNDGSATPNSPPVELDFRAPKVAPQPSTLPPNELSQPAPEQPVQPSQPKPSSTAPTQRKIVEVNSNRQEYDAQRQVVTAEGNVVVRLEDAVLDADRLQVSLPNLIAVGEGNVVFRRGQQILRGERFVYNIVQNSGNIQAGTGEIYIPTAGSDFADPLATDVTTGSIVQQPPSARLTANQPLQEVTSAGGISFTLGSGRNTGNIPQPPGGEVRRLRFEAEKIDFYPEGWQANDVRITNDPFSPPELELRADTVTLTRETPLRDRIKTTKQRLVFDQGLTVGIPRDEAVIDRTERDTSPALAQIGYDGEDRGGLFIERGFSIFNSEGLQFNLKPQFLVQKTIADNNGNPLDLLGLKANLRALPGQRTAVTGSATFTSLDLTDIEDSLRANLLLQQLFGTRLPHTVALEATYRDRIYNGTLGYRTVQSSLGATVASPVIPLGKSGINLSYQAGFQRINADTDRLEFLEPDRDNDRTSLSRFQGSFALNRGFVLWQGKGLPPTADQGLKYTPVPIVPYIVAFAGLTGTSSFYSNGDNQSTLIGTVGFEGQFGRFSRPFLDYTRLNVSYSEGLRDGISPFLFDRAADTRAISLGITQQIYGPLRFGFQTAINLDNNERISTDYVLEYSRRTYGLVLRYNPELEIGSISLRISDFNWSGSTDPFSDLEVRPVIGGVKRR